jgi:hypothetical protein
METIKFEFTLQAHELMNWVRITQDARNDETAATQESQKKRHA